MEGPAMSSARHQKRKKVKKKLKTGSLEETVWMVIRE